MIKMTVFWKYDTFPYCLYGELITIGDKYFTVKGYDNINFKVESVLAVMPSGRAKETIVRLEYLESERRAKLVEFDKKAKQLVGEMKEWNPNEPLLV